MTAAPEDVPAYRLYTSEQAAERAGDGLTKSTFDALARSGEVDYTRIRRKVRWTDEQIAAAIAYCATKGGEEAKASAPTPRDRTTPVPERRRGSVAPLVSKPGSRYAAAR